MDRTPPTPLKILLVEDNQTDAFLVRDMLLTFRDLPCEVEWVSSYDSGRQAISEKRHDAYLIDYRLSQFEGAPDGLQLLREAREAGSVAPLIVLTGEEYDDSDIQAAHVGADDYIQKQNLAPHSLQRTLRYAIEHSHYLEELRAAQQHSRILISAMNHSSAGVLITDPQQPDNPIIYSNPRFCEMTGYTREEVRGRNCRFLQGPGTDEAARQRMRSAIREGRNYEGNILNYRKDGTPFWNSLKITAVHDAHGTIINYVGIQTDVTAQVESQTTRNRLAAIVSSSPDAIYSRDFNGIVTSWNRGAEELFGYSAEEIIGKSVLMLMDHSLVDSMHEGQEHLKRGEHIHHVDSTGYHKDGRRLEVSISLAPIVDEKGEVTEIAAIARDISQTKRYEKALEDTNRRITTIWESINEGFFALDEEGRITYINQHAQNLMQRTLSEVLGENLWELFPDAVDTEFYRRHQLIQQTREPQHYEAYYAPYDFWLEVHAYPSDNGCAVYMRDISERKHTERAIDQLNQQLQRTNRELFLAYDTTIEGWSRALDLRDKETEGHSLRVTHLTIQLAQAAGINAEDLAHVRRGALLHDIGKMGIPDSILLKPGPLTDEEWVSMKMHPVYAMELLSPIEFLRDAIPIPYCHHEKWDGSGYPNGLQGEDIPLAARLFAVVDVWDALTSDRPYRAAWTKERALAYIQEQSGKHFDPAAVQAFLKVVQ